MKLKRLTIIVDNGLDETNFKVSSDREGAYNILDIAKYSDEKEMQEILLNIASKLGKYEDIGLEPDEIKKLLGRLEKYEWKYGSAECAMDYAEYAGNI